MFDWENLRFFLAIAQFGSLSGAARHLKVDHATVSRRLGALEAELQLRLVDRLPRASVLTESGRKVLAFAASMEEDAFSIARLAQADQVPMQGKVTVSMPPVLATNFFAQQLRIFSERYPNIQLSVASQTHSVSLGRREADIAVRLFRPEEPGNVTRRIGTMPFAVYASRDYSAATDPATWGVIAYDAQFADMPHQKWLLAIAAKRRIVCELSDITTQHMAARTGVGVAGLPVFIGDNDPVLQRLPFDGEPFHREIWLVVHADLRHTPLIRTVIDFVSEAVGRTFNVEGQA
ncbi:LysR family transcriptional regulator [Robbsia sp. KACC 23696]|uniref:LysR family transcriptional regulator n=1 Tax=Robbsia sp. KACC 23696 TaxID=3149231 RepID=UPI00325C30D3